MDPLLRATAQDRLSLAGLASQEKLRKQSMFRPSRQKCCILVRFPNVAEEACARNAEPGNVSGLLTSPTILCVLGCLQGDIKKRLAC